LDRRGFFGWLGKGAAGAAAALVLKSTDVEAAPPAKLSEVVSQRTLQTDPARAEMGPEWQRTRHFAILMNYDGIPIKTMMVDDLPLEIHIDWIAHTARNTNVTDDRQHAFPSAGTSHYMKERSEFRLVSKDMYDGRTIEGLARYILFRGPDPGWPQVRLGF
jgi:hypothetical protein